MSGIYSPIAKRFGEVSNLVHGNRQVAQGTQRVNRYNERSIEADMGIVT